jgi:hypothetical protein
MATITDDYKIKTLADNVVAREYEVFGYQLNIDNYTAMLAALPTDEWDALSPEIQKWRGAKTEDLPESLPVEVVSLVSDLQYRDRLRALLRTEAVEQNKAQRVHDALLSQIPAEVRETALVEAVTRRGGAP